MNSRLSLRPLPAPTHLSPIGAALGLLWAISFVGLIGVSAADAATQKWISYPDLSANGMDVEASESFVLADDFLCQKTGPITQISIWGSWKNDVLPPLGGAGAVSFKLSIHADIPASQNPDGYSIPGETLWTRTVAPGQFSVQIYQDDITEGWLTPPSSYLFPGDHVCYQYTFTIPTLEAFVQQGTFLNGIVYWLDVQAIPGSPTARFGWKTAMTHWNDNAVWGQGVEPFAGPWYGIHYPLGHPLFGQPVDLAFVIAGDFENEYDFGDAPGTFPTLLANNGARHAVVPGYFMGSLIDPEPDGIPEVFALGDDSTDYDDEDGVVVVGRLTPGDSATVQVTASVNGYVRAWVDFAMDGDWADAGEQIYSGAVHAGVNTMRFLVPSNSHRGTSFARFRFSTTLPTSYVGASANGEVEDHKFFVDYLDFGDAPDGFAAPGYPTFLANNGARHTYATGVTLGSAVDFESDGQPQAQALGDDNAGTDDEDGVTWPDLFVPGTTARAFVTTSTAGYVDAFFDWNRDLDWDDAGEHPVSVVAPGAGDYIYVIDVPLNAVAGQSFARVRFNTTGNVAADGYGGVGEVEDYEITLQPPPEYKWVQYPDLSTQGIDVRSSNPYRLADDFQCTEPGVITSIRVWGSWLGDNVQPGSFKLRIHADIPASQSPTGYSMPGDVLWEKSFNAGTYGTYINGTGLHEGWLTPPTDYTPDADQTCFQYVFNMDPKVGFYQEGNPAAPKVYWLHVKAYPSSPEAFFGWKTSTTSWNDAAVWGTFGEFANGPWTRIVNPITGGAIHLAFALLSEPATVEYGDAPAPTGAPGYPTLRASDGARHRVDPAVTLGVTVDTDPDGQPNANATGDDVAGLDDEDGVTFLTWFKAGKPARVRFQISATGYLSGWIDWNRDADWNDPDEDVVHEFSGAGFTTVTIPVPLGAQPGLTFARFRYSSVDWTEPTGYIGDGEVEDYAVQILEPVGTPEEEAPKQFMLYDASPNPFAGATSVRFDLPRDTHARVDVFAVDGRRVATLLDKEMPAGRHDAVWDGRDERGAAATAGRYYIRIQADAFLQTRPVVLLK